MTSILVVDHDHALRNTTRSHLEQAGYDVVTAKTGQEAIMIARHSRPDLIVSDLGSIDLRRLRDDALIGGVPVVLLSVRALNEHDRERALKAGALELIERSPDFKRELTWIRVAVQQVRGES